MSKPFNTGFPPANSLPNTRNINQTVLRNDPNLLNNTLSRNNPSTLPNTPNMTQSYLGSGNFPNVQGATPSPNIPSLAVMSADFGVTPQFQKLFSMFCKSY